MRRREHYNPLLKSYPESEKVNAVSEGAEVLYVRLVAISDDAGCYYGDARWVMAKLFTARMAAGEVTTEEIERRLCELEQVGLIMRYQAGASVFLQLVDVFKTMRKDVKPQFLYPQPDTTTVTHSDRPRNDCGPLDQDQEPEPTPEPECDLNCALPQRISTESLSVGCARDAQKVAIVVQPEKPADWKLIVRVCALKEVGSISENALWDAVTGLERTTAKVGNRTGYFQTCVIEKSKMAKPAFLAMMRAVDVDDETLAMARRKPEPRLMEATNGDA